MLCGMSVSPEQPRRRADIQGLRAVAVLAVIGFHVFGWPQGGYLGVDAFFVVSGFVITGLLLRERERTGRTSLRAFWARRARRILPLALVVIAAVVAVAPLAWAGPKVAAVRTDAIWATFFAANWHFAEQSADYFQLGSEPSPLLHYWSLGVEEQFYLAWPLLVVLALALAGAAHRSRVALVVLAAVVGIPSLAWAVAQGASDPTTAYYSTFTRGWELALGAALATVPAVAATHRRYAVRLAPVARTALSWAGLAILLASVALLSPATGVPWPAALGATIGTALVLVAGIGAGAPGSVLLTNRVSGYLGDISFGLYLWHFPLVVIVPVFLSASRSATAVVVLVGTLLLAVISHHLLERPVLDAPRVRPRAMLASGLALVLLVGVVGGAAAMRPDLFSGGTVVASGADAEGAVETPAGGVPAPEPTPEPTPTATSASPTATGPTPSPSAPTTTAAAGWAPIPLGATGTRVQNGLSEALASTSWPSDLNPSPDAWQTMADPRMSTGACTATRASDPDSCTFGNRKGPEIIVYGDSIGIPLLATVVKAYGSTYKVRGMTKIGCAVNGVDANFGKDEWAIPCVRHRQMVLDYVRRVKPKILIMTETYSWAVRLKSKAKGSASAKEWLAADQAFVDSVRESVGSVVIVAPSMPGVAFLDCYRPGGSPRRCVTGIPAWWARTRDVEKKVVGAHFIDTTHWYCVDGRCPLFTGTTDTIVKGDYLHTSVQYARQLAPDFAYLMKASGALP
ncbi:peptidoglycan/LPS O-acetylase OafA/YrhL [Humibacillus xanthopallidus]|uniref:Peptidoglycan/LPS O-acetylase OafA/YrhL n=2 Tax=Humibacillus xanthopallidus TaxID=412689 RepID=A0A543I320_9MICO|nr:peptidoglycan/LPS O-acetylase OafA/YrhL [Humibacillus xanthopallidus]